MSDDDDTSWTIELETSLVEGCTFEQIRQLCKSRPIPEHLRAEVWPICLGVDGKYNTMSGFDELFDMPEQDILNEDCQALVDRLGNEEDEKVSVASDLESIVTFYCKSSGVQYERESGWLDVLQPMLALRMSRTDLYNCFSTMHQKYVPRDCEKNGRPLHLFRLLLLYHDPELCSFLDTKRVTPDYYAMEWFRSLFSSTCDLNVTLSLWDVYLQNADPFLIFFLALVVLVNAKDQLLQMVDSSRQEIVTLLASFPNQLDAEDVADLCALAAHYASNTPQSFRTDYADLLYASDDKKSGDVTKATETSHVEQALCLPVSVNELLHANRAGGGVRYFVIDCRPAEQYNSGHLHIAFHLDANLMLQNPTEFSTAVSALLTAQRQAIQAESVAGGEHLCFIGSGREAEDQYVHMVVAHFLQRYSIYVSIARGGYAAMHSALRDDLSAGLTDHTPRSCIVCTPSAAGTTGGDEEHDSDTQGSDVGPSGAHAIGGVADMDSIRSKLGKLSTAMKSTSSGWKSKVINYIKNEHTPAEHVSATDRGPRYRGMASVFTIGDDEEEAEGGSSSEDERRDVVNVDTWLKKPDVLHSFKCQELRDSGYMYNSYLLVTNSHLYNLREMPHKRGMAWIQARRALGSIVKITSKKKHPEVITFKYGSNQGEKGLHITDQDRFVIPKAGEATKVVKTQIMRVLESLDSAS